VTVVLGDAEVVADSITALTEVRREALPAAALAGGVETGPDGDTGSAGGVEAGAVAAGSAGE
jgi:hypothetical protein